MALSASSLASRIKEKITEKFGQAPDETYSAIDLIAQAVVEEIKEKAVVLPTSLFSPPGLSGGPITGTGKVE